MKVTKTVLTTNNADDLPIEDVVDKICLLNQGIQKFWSNCAGWAPPEAAELLGEVRLDWQSDLSTCLHLWTSKKNSQLSPGNLILAWTNLGSLVEGSLKLLLSVYLNDYLADHEGAIKSGSLTKNGIPKSPEKLKLQQLKVFFSKKGLLGEDGDALIDLVQARRNTVHAFKNAEIGTQSEFEFAVRGYFALLKKINLRLPYPDDVYDPGNFV